MSRKALALMGVAAVALLASGCRSSLAPTASKGPGSDPPPSIAIPVVKGTAQPSQTRPTPEDGGLGCSEGCPPPWHVSDECCNLFGCDCDGPCWNAGCKTVCGTGDWKGYPLACLGDDDTYTCCPTGSKCKPGCSVSDNDCCCWGDDKTIVSVASVTYDLEGATEGPDSTSAQVNYLYRGENAGPTPAPVGTITSSVTSTQTSQWSFQTATEISASATVEAGIPLFAEGKLTVGVKETLTYGTQHSQSVATSLNISMGDDTVPAYSYQEYQFDATMYQYNIPFTATATVIDDCGTTSQETVEGSTKLAGIASFTQGQFSKIIGPAVPIECTAPFDTPIADQKDGNFCSSGPLCSENALCLRYGQTTGTCCASGAEQQCCAVAAGHKQCIEDGYEPSEQLCPSTNGNFAPCCDIQSTLPNH